MASLLGSRKKIAVVGGSGVSTPSLVVALRDLLSEQISVVLVGRNRGKLEAVAQTSRTLAPEVPVDWTDRLAEAIEGATVIVNQVRVGGLDGRAWDEKAPTTLGLIGEETMGAGGFALGFRTLPAIRSLLDAISHYSPEASLVNLTNPAGLVISTIAAEAPRLMAVSVCDVPVSTVQIAEKTLGQPLSECRWIGTNHAGFLTSARDQAGHDRLPEILSRLPETYGVAPSVCQAIGALPSPYLRFIYHQRRFIPEAPVVRSRADQLLGVQSQLLSAYAKSETGTVQELLSERNPHWYREIVAPVVAAFVDEGRSARFIVQLPNRGKVPFLSEDAALEAAVYLSPNGPARTLMDPVPADLRSLMVQLTECDELIRQASLTKDSNLAIRALALNPLVGDFDTARAFWRLFSERWNPFSEVTEKAW